MNLLMTVGTIFDSTWTALKPNLGDIATVARTAARHVSLGSFLVVLGAENGHTIDEWIVSTVRWIGT